MGLAAGLMAAGGILQAGNSIAQGRAQSAYYNAQAQSALDQARLNEIAADRQVSYDMQAAAAQQQRVIEDERQSFGSMLAAMAAGGMSTLSGSAQNLALSSLRNRNRDLENISTQVTRSAYETRLNAELATYGAQAQAAQLRSAASSAKTAGYIGAAGSLLGTASQLAWMYGQPKTPKATLNEADKKDFNGFLKNTAQQSKSNPFRLTGTNKLDLGFTGGLGGF